MCTLGIPIEILLVEDNPGDVDLAREALENSKIRNTLSVVGDGDGGDGFSSSSAGNTQQPHIRTSFCWT